MLKQEWGAESNGKLPHLYISLKTAALVPEFEVKDLPLSRHAVFAPEFAVKDLPLGRTHMMITINSSREKLHYISTILTLAR